MRVRNYWDHQYGFRRNKSTTDQVFSNRQTGENIGVQQSSIISNL